MVSSTKASISATSAAPRTDAPASPSRHRRPVDADHLGQPRFVQRLPVRRQRRHERAGSCHVVTHFDQRLQCRDIRRPGSRQSRERRNLGWVTARQRPATREMGMPGRQARPERIVELALDIGGPHGADSAMRLDRPRAGRSASWSRECNASFPGSKPKLASRREGAGHAK